VGHQQVRNVTTDLSDAGIPTRLLVRDRDTKYVESPDNVFKAQGAEILRTPYRTTPNANAFARTVRAHPQIGVPRPLAGRERSPPGAHRSYARHYNGHRPHQGIAQEIPAPERAAPLQVLPTSTVDTGTNHDGFVDTTGWTD
jgi:putative transposase